MNFITQAILGNLARSFWFCPPLAKLLHSLRGINFTDRGSVFITEGVTLDNKYPKLINIGRDVWLTRGVVVLSHSYASIFQQECGLKEKVGSVYIEDGVFIGTGSIILPGVRLGKGCYIGAGSVVNKSIPAGALAAGNPCKVINEFFLDGIK
jgi:galactoside O-acetyltransferase